MKTIVERTASLPISRESLPKAPDTNEDGYPHTPSKLMMSFTLFLTASSNLGFNNTSKNSSPECGPSYSKFRAKVDIGLCFRF